MTSELENNRSIVHSCQYQVVWCPKYRRKVLIEGVETRLEKILREVVTEAEGEILDLVILPDQVRTLVQVDPQYGIVKLIRNMKGQSSRLLREEFAWLRSRLPTLWTNSYFVASVGGAEITAIEEYVKNQKNV
jgi:putative transposase